MLLRGIQICWKIVKGVPRRKRLKSTGLELQCAREYWTDNDDDQRVTAVHKLTPEEQSNIPTENLEAERYLAKFGALASMSARHSNRFFKAKRNRDDLTLNSEHHADNPPDTIIFASLDIMEQEWNADQKALQKARLQDSLAKGQRASEFVDVILKKCKEYGGPVTNIKELNQMISKFDNRGTKKLLRQEIQFQKAMHSRDQ